MSVISFNYEIFIGILIIGNPFPIIMSISGEFILPECTYINVQIIYLSVYQKYLCFSLNCGYIYVAGCVL